MYPKNARKLTMFKNGILLEGSEFRSHENPQTQVILDQLMQGRVPPELFGSTEPRGDVEILLVDKRSENYVPPFSSAAWNNGAEGHVMGKKAGQPSTTFSSDSITDAEQVALDDAKPSTTIQVKMANGEKLKLKLNHSSKVMEVLKTIKVHGGASRPFTLR